MISHTPSPGTNSKSDLIPRQGSGGLRETTNVAMTETIPAISQDHQGCDDLSPSGMINDCFRLSGGEPGSGEGR